ncbi:MAG: glycosyltransferase [Microbacterium gubbeenense]
MPAPVHAVLVTRSSPSAAARIARALAALDAQTRPVDSMSIVVCGDPSPVREAVDASSATTAVTVSERATFAAAIEAAIDRVPEGSHAWLIDDGSIPEPNALASLTAALERQPSVAVAAPKLVQAADRRRIESFGTTMTRWGRTVDLARSEYDQGQHDHADDVLGADARGMLLSHDVVADLVPDRALSGIDEGLDIGVRARLAGRRLALAPRARVAVWPAHRPTLAHAYASRVARLHRRLAYAHPALVFFQWLLLLPLALWATIVALFAKLPGRVAPEWMAAVTVLVRIPSIARSRSRLRRFRTGSWAQVDPLRLTRAELRAHQHASDDTRTPVRAPLRFFSGGGAWVVLASLVASIGAFIALLTWPAMSGGALLPLRGTVAGLWSDAFYGLRPEGIDQVAPADPFSVIVAILGSAWPAAPSYALVLLWLLAAPLAVLGGWFAATRVADGAAARITLALLWGAAPPLWSALAEGRPAAVILHLLLPWLAYCASAAHRAWTTAGAASLLLAAVLACAPSLGPAALVLWLAALVAAICVWRRGIARIVWIIVPTVAMFFPVAAAHVERGTGWALLADPGAPVPFAHGDAWSIAAGFVDLSAWPRLLADLGITADGASWVPLLVVPVAVIALVAPATGRTWAAVGALAAAALGSITAVAAVGAGLVFAEGEPVPVWPGSALSLGWLGLALAAAITIDAVRRTAVRRLAGIIAVVAVIVAIAPQVTSLHRGATPLASGEFTTLPAYVAAEATGDREIGTLVVEPLTNGSAEAHVVWGSSETLGGSSVLANSAVTVSSDDEWLAEVAASVISGSAEAITQPLADAGVSFVLLRQSVGSQNTDQRVMALTAQASMDQRAGFVRVGETERGVLWRVDGELTERGGLTGSDTTTAWTVGAIQVAILIAALLLAISTRRTRDEAKLVPRTIGDERKETP